MWWKLKLHWQIAIAMFMGLGAGILFQALPGGEPGGWFYGGITAMGTIFIRLLRMVIVPLIFTSIVTGVAGVGDSRRLGRLGSKTFAYYLVSSLLAIVIGILLANAIRPGEGARIGAGHDFDAAALEKPASIGQILIDMIPLNPIKAAADGQILGVIFFAILLGVGLNRLGGESRRLLEGFFRAGFDVMMQITEMIIRLAPLGVFGLMTQAVAGAGLELFRTLGLYMVTILTGFSLHMFVVLPTLLFFSTRLDPRRHFRAMAPAIMTAFSTCSSNATLPVTMNNVEKRAGVSNTVSSFVLPLGATVNMNGTALYECAGVIFISQVLAMKLTLAQQFTVVLTALLSAIGCAGIPSAGLVVIFIVTQAIGFRDAQVGVIIGAMLAVDRPLDMFRTTVNIFSDSVGAVIVAHSEGEKGLYPEAK
ncbi:MAG: dicarboxylate/amino acid:cation symporter [Acidobacteriota bacterium]|jgi:Na+/H+-dicarboxylate symporter|nr:dicarboxylate/amino acid:cation symporter [Acidobacteriota bacterium]